MLGLEALAALLGLHERRCPVCLAPFTPQPCATTVADCLFCPQCSPSFAPLPQAHCSACALPLPLGTPAGTLCGRCARSLPPWAGLRSYGLYEGALRSLLLRFKFAGEVHLAPILAALLLECLTCLPAADALVPIPQHPAHLRQRGYNQAHELALALAAHTALPCETRALQRVQPVPSQTTLSGQQRHSAPRASFACHSAVQGKKLMLVDDICTTGGTLFHAAHCLLHAGAQAVYCLTVARTAQH